MRGGAFCQTLPPMLRDLRARTGHSQTALAMLMGTDPSTIARWESGKRAPSLDTLRRLAAVLVVEISVTPEGYAWGYP